MFKKMSMWLRVHENQIDLGMSATSAVVNGLLVLAIVMTLIGGIARMRVWQVVSSLLLLVMAIYFMIVDGKHAIRLARWLIDKHNNEKEA